MKQWVMFVVLCTGPEHSVLSCGTDAQACQDDRAWPTIEQCVYAGKRWLNAAHAWEARSGLQTSMSSFFACHPVER